MTNDKIIDTLNHILEILENDDTGGETRTALHMLIGDLEISDTNEYGDDDWATPDEVRESWDG